MYNYWLDFVFYFSIISFVVFWESKRKKFGFFGKILRGLIGRYDIPWYEKEENKEIVEEIEFYERQRKLKEKRNE